MNAQPAVSLTQELVRLNTTNPPGNESPAVDLLEGRLRHAGFETTVVPYPVGENRSHVVARLRGTGAGFCYNVGRIIAAGGPFLVGMVASRGTDALATAMKALFWIGVFPVLGVLLLPLVVETKDRALE